MGRFICDGSYGEDLRRYTEEVVLKYGVSSPNALREIRCMADEGNTVAEKLYADLVFYRKLLRKYPYREAFSLYLKSSGITVSEDETWTTNGAAYPLSFWMLGTYLVDYRRGSSLMKCEKISAIDDMPLPQRFLTALELAVSCIGYVNAPGAVNLIGRILQEASGSEELFSLLQPVIREQILGKTFPEFTMDMLPCGKAADCADIAERFFAEAVREGYVYACNNLAAREAERIAGLGADEEDQRKECIRRYLGYLKLSADKYEPYAANRLGLYYVTGEIAASTGKMVFREDINFALAKEYFLKATVYPDANSAWAFFNLIKYFQKDFDQDIEKMNEYMDAIRELNPEVYDLAMEL